MVTPNGALDAQRRRLAEVAASLDARARELMSRQVEVERREAGLGPREAALGERERRLRELEGQLEAIRRELIAKAQSLVAREAELAERERRLEERAGEMEEVRRAEEARAIFETKTAQVAELAEELRRREESLGAPEGGGGGEGGGEGEGPAAQEAGAAPPWLPPILAGDWSRPAEGAPPLQLQGAPPGAPPPAQEEPAPSEAAPGTWDEPQMMELPPPVPLEATGWAEEGPAVQTEEEARAERVKAMSEGEARDIIARAERAASEARMAGADISEASRHLTSAQELLMERRYQEAAGEAQRGLVLAAQARRMAEEGRRASSIESARRVVEEVRLLGAQVAEAEALLDRAAEALQTAEHALAERYAREAEARARQSGESFSRASQGILSLDTIMRESQRRLTELDLSEVEEMKREAQAAFDRGDYGGALEKARMAERRLHEIELGVQQMAADRAPAHGAAALQRAPRPQKYRCPSCTRPFQVIPPERRPFNVACPWCGSTVRVTR
ncbi:MAG: hypothetical protein ACUVV6_04430 [Thermoplasmatota archaeon]